MEKRDLKSNYIYNTIARVVSIIVPLLTAPYISRTLGVDNVGRYSYTASIVTYFSVLAVFGSSTYGQRQIAYHKNNTSDLNDSFSEVFLFRCISAIIAIALYSLYLLSVHSDKTLAIIYGLNILDVAIDISWLFNGLEMFKQLMIRNIAVRILSLVSILLLVRKPSDVWIYVLIICGDNIICNLSMWPFAFRNVKLVLVNPFKNIIEIASIFLPTIAIQIYAVLDKSMIGWLTQSASQNGCYEQAEKIARLSLTVVTSLSTVVLPKIANLYFENKTDLAKTYIYKAYRVTFLLSIPMTVGLASISSILIPVFLGNGYEDAIVLLEILSSLIVFVSLASITGLSWLVPTGQQNIYTISVTVAAVSNFIMNNILIRCMQAKGAAIATVFAEGIAVLIQIGYCFYHKQLNIYCITRQIWKYFIAAFIMACFIFASKVVIPANAIGLLFLIIVASIVYFVILFLLREELLYSFLINKRKNKRT